MRGRFRGADDESGRARTKLTADHAQQTAQAPSWRSRDAEARKRLSSVAWSFPERGRHADLEALHPYPAKFIAEIPRAVLACVPPEPGTTVLDPFCGSGTTLAEAQRLGLPSVGIDLNPIACLISRVRTSDAPAGLGEVAEGVARSALASPAAVPEIPNLDHWFNPEAQRTLAALVAAIAREPEGVARDALSLALSSIVVRVSNQDSDTRYAAVPNDVTGGEVVAAFVRAAARIGAALEARGYPLAPARVIEGDTLAVAPEAVGRSVGLVVTSPPYPNAYEYWLYHKYRMWWLGLDPLAVKAREIGARAHFFRKNHHTPEDFARQMGSTLDLMASVMRTGAHACFVVGRSRIHGRTVDNAAVIAAEAEARGFERVFDTEREIASTRKSFNLSHANIKRETVMVLRLGERLREETE